MATFKQRPGELARLQLRQGPAQALSQQTLSTHWPDSHSVAPVQGCPGFFLPQVPLVTPLMVCDTHWCPASQSASLTQFWLHALLVQRKGEQSTSWGSRQAPWPSHVRGVFSTSPEQEDGPHTVFSGYRVHEPSPSQRPVLPQVVRSLALHAGSGRPAGMYVQKPTDPVWLHDTQSPLHARLQHTPSVQKPEVHSALVRQGWRMPLVPQLPATHCCPAAHWALVVQVRAQWLLAGSQL